jgi:tetratricopeptide (TPR) repeat protein
MLKHKFSILILTLALSFPSLAQVVNSDFQKLYDLYTMEKYEKCAYKAESYTRKDKYRRSAEPYLYMALCHYQAHVHPELFTNEFPDALKDAMKYAYKFRKKDKTGELYEPNKFLLDKIREEALMQAKFYYNNEDYRKAASEFKRILKVLPDDVNIMFMTGVSMIESKNLGEGQKFVDQALDSLKLFEEQNRFEKDEVTHEMLIKGVIAYTKYLDENAKLEKALEIITMIRKLIPDEPRIKTQYARLYSKVEE